MEAFQVHILAADKTFYEGMREVEARGSTAG